METVLSYLRQYATALGNRLWKRYVTAYGNGMQPLMETVLSYLRQYATALGNRLWKWYATAYGNGVKLPKTICNRFRQPL
jgi:hypothetical protein